MTGTAGVQKGKEAYLEPLEDRKVAEVQREALPVLSSSHGDIPPVSDAWQ